MNLPKINLPPIDPKYKVAGILGLIALVFGAYYDHAYKPPAKIITQLQDEMLALDDTLQVIKTVEYPLAKDDAAILAEIEQKKNKLSAQILIEEKKLPAKSELSNVLKRITDLAYESGFEIRSMEPKDFTIQGAYQSMSLAMEINTQYKNILMFLDKIRELPIRPEYLEINVVNRPNLTIKLQLSIFFR